MTAPGFGNPPTLKTQFFLAPSQNFAQRTVRQNALDALYLMGEYSIFVLMWTAFDFQQGLVSRCRRCISDQNRAFAAYDQPTTYRCPDCYGTTFAGGYRAKVVRPCLWTDTSTELDATNRGVVYTDTVSVETTSELTIRHGDLIIRHDNTRYQTSETSPVTLRNGFEHPANLGSLSNVVHQAKKDDPTTSVSYTIAPTNPLELATLLRQPTSHYPMNYAAFDEIRPGGYL